MSTYQRQRAAKQKKHTLTFFSLSLLSIGLILGTRKAMHAIGGTPCGSASVSEGDDLLNLGSVLCFNVINIAVLDWTAQVLGLVPDRKRKRGKKVKQKSITIAIRNKLRLLNQ